MALALMLPFTFTMQPVTGISLLLATYIGGMTGGSISAILIGIPGTPSAAATVSDGYSLSKKGDASIALGTAVIVSTIGGLISLSLMIVMVDFISKFAIKFGPAEIFMLVLFGFSTICGLAEKSLFTIDTIIKNISRTNYNICEDLINAALNIKGYGHVKEKNIKIYEEKWNSFLRKIDLHSVKKVS